MIGALGSVGFVLTEAQVVFLILDDDDVCAITLVSVGGETSVSGRCRVWPWCFSLCMRGNSSDVLVLQDNVCVASNVVLVILKRMLRAKKRVSARGETKGRSRGCVGVVRAFLSLGFWFGRGCFCCVRVGWWELPTCAIVMVMIG